MAGAFYLFWEHPAPATAPFPILTRSLTDWQVNGSSSAQQPQEVTVRGADAK